MNPSSVLEREIDTLILTGHDGSWPARLRAAQAMLSRVCELEAPPMDAAVRLAEHVVLRALGHRAIHPEPSRTERGAYAGLARAFDRTAECCKEPDLRHVLCDLALALDPKAGDDSQPARMTALLARWSHAQRVLHPLAHRPRLANGSHERAWTQAARLTPVLLCEALGRSPFNLDRAHLGAWFVLRLLPVLDAERNMARGALWRARAAAAGAMLELLRQLTWGDRSDFRFAPDPLRAHLLHLMDVHLHRVLKVPRNLRVPDLLAELGTGDHGGDLPRLAAQQQHVVDVYLFSKLVLDASREGPRPLPVDEAMVAIPGAARGGRARARALRQAIGIAALHRGVGRVLLEGLSADAHRVAEALDLDGLSLDQGLSSAAEQLLTRCAAELDAQHLLLLDPQAASHSPRIAQALVDAWVAARLSAEAGVDPDVITAAVRALQLHADATLTVEPANDPAAALLILAEVLFDGDGHPEPVREILVRDPHAVTGAVLPRPGRFVSARLDGVHLRVDGPHASAHIGADAPWPALTCTARSPDAGGGPAWETWLHIAQTLGRIEVDAQRWSPRVQLVAPRTGPTTWDRLDRLVTRRPRGMGRAPAAIARWLEDEHRFAATRREERVDVHPLTHRQDLRDTLAALERALHRLDDTP